MMQKLGHDLEEVRRLCAEGLFVQAYALTQQFGPLEHWQGADERILAGRLAYTLGGTRLGYSIHLRNYRQHPKHLNAALYAGYARLLRRGPWATRAIVARHEPQTSDGPVAISDWYTFRAQVAAMFRDFERAEELVAQAMQIAPEQAWVYVAQSHVLEIADRVDDAVAAVQRALELQPRFRPALLSAARLYALQGHRDRAIDLLERASRQIECGEVALMLADFKLENQDPAGALAAIDQAERLLPLMDAEQCEVLAARRCEASYRNGDEAAAIAAGQSLINPYHREIITRLQAAQDHDKRVVLPVPFVRQHHLTCAPATLTSISQYWGRPADHVRIAEEICFDGTPDHSERRWAEQSGYVAREFTIDWPTAVALIDRQIPFTFTTVEVASAHLQAVIGYDSRRGTLVLRDPSSPVTNDMIGERGLQYYRGYGPRGMVLVPPEKAALLSEVELPDADRYDDYYLAQRLLQAHDREQAVLAIERLESRGADHRLALAARMMLAGYDSDPTTQYRVYEQWSRQYPDNAPLRFAMVATMRNVLPRADRIAVLEEDCAAAECEPSFRLYLVEELLDDARCHDRIRWQLRKVLRRRPLEARAHYALANLAWNQRQFDVALESFRIAAGLDETREYCSQRYFSAARERGRTDEALRWLSGRARRFAAKSCEPAKTLAWALNLLDRQDEALAALEDVLAARPDDSSLLLYLAESYSAWGHFDKAQAALDRCRSTAHLGQWLRTAAMLAWYRGDLQQSLAYWRQLEVREPQSAEVAVRIAGLQKLSEGREAAQAELRAKLARFPNNVELLRAAVDWWRDPQSGEVLELIDQLLAHSPGDPWAHRERALALLRAERIDEAREEALLAIEIMPGDSWGHSVLGFVESQAGDLRAAAASYRRALELNVDNESAMHGLLQIGTTHAERAAELAYLYEQLVRQTTLGDGLSSYASLAKKLLEPEELLANLRAALDARPDLWHAWSVVVHQLIEMQRPDEALQLANQSCQRFSLLPGAWLDRASACSAAGDGEGEIAALERANELNRNWPQAVYRLAEAHLHQGDHLRAKSVIELAIQRMPLEPVLHGFLAQVCRYLKLQGQVLLALRRAVELDSDYAWAWETLQEYGNEVGQGDLAAKTARRLVERQPGNARAWYWLARMLSGPEQREERDAALRRSIELDPDSPDAHIFRSQLLAAAGRHDEAVEACRPPVFCDRVPLELQLQELQVEAERGQLDAAIERLRSMLRENDDYTPGWRRLAHWCEAREDLAETYLEAARRLVRLDPLSGDSWKALGNAHLKAGERAKSREAFAHALELAPCDLYTGAMLFDLQADDLDWESAQRTLECLRSAGTDPWSSARWVRLAVARRDQPLALQAMEEICQTPCDGDWPLSFAMAQLRTAGCHRQVWQLLTKYSSKPRGNFVLAEYISGLGARKEFRRAAKLLDRYPDETFDWKEAAKRLIVDWADASQPRRMKRFVDRHRAVLHGDTQLWAKVGYAFKHCDRPQWAIDWMRDWRLRDDTEPWMLLNLVAACYLRKKDDWAAEVGQAAIRLPADSETPKHHSWLAVQAAARGDFDAARTHLENADPADDNVFFKSIGQFSAATLATCEQLGQASRPSSWRIFWTFYRHSRGANVFHPTLARIRAQCLRRVFINCGRPRAGRALEWILVHLGWNLF